MSEKLTLLYSSDPLVAGYRPMIINGEHTYGDDEGNEIDPDFEFEMFEEEFKSVFENAPGWIARGTVTDWQGASPGGKVFVGKDFKGIMMSFFSNTDGYGGLSVYYDPEDKVFVFRTANHDGGMDMVVRRLTDKGVGKYLDGKDEFERIDLEKELFANPYSEQVVLEGF